MEDQVDAELKELNEKSILASTLTDVQENRLQAYKQWIRGKMRRYGVYGRGRKAPRSKSTLEGRKLAAQMGKIADNKRGLEE